MQFLIYFKYLIQFFVFKLILITLNIFSIKTSSIILSNTLLFFGRLTKYNQIAKNNCKVVFPDLDEKRITQIINKSWKNLGNNISEINNLKKLINDKNAIIIKGINIIEKLKKDDSQFIFFGIHSSNWEICVPLLDHNDFKIGAIYRHINNKFFDRYIYKQRSDALKTKKSFYTPKGRISAKEILDGVINKKSIFLLVDQKDSAGTLVNFFGKKVKTQTGFLKIARKYNLKIIPMKNVRLPNNKLEITFEEPLEHSDESITDDEKMLEINSIVERWIKENPENWLWQHKRFS